MTKDELIDKIDGDALIITLDLLTEEESEKITVKELLVKAYELYNEQ